MGDLFPPSEVLYWIPTDKTRNFGDYISELLLERALIAPRIRASRYRLIGSIIDNENVSNDLSSITDGGNVVYWGCGAREATPIHEVFLPRCEFYGVRGPLTRDLLRLPAETVLGDPALLLPLIRPAASVRKRHGKAVCIPHIHEPKSDAELMTISGAEVVIRPAIAPTLEALDKIIDQISGADFVLAGAMHAAILAHAYGIPFAFFDTGHLDIPFKWRDFAGSIEIPAVFVRDVSDGRAAYRDLIHPKAKRLPLLPILAGCPYYVYPSIVAKAAAHDAGIGADPRLISAMRVAAIEASPYAEAAMRSDQVRNARLQARFDEQSAALSEAQLSLAQAAADIERSKATSAELDTARAALVAKEAELSEIEHLHRSAENDCGRLMAESEHVRVELARAKAASADLRWELELSRKDAADLRAELDDAGGRFDALRVEVDHLETERAAFAKRLSSERIEFETDRAQLSEKLVAVEAANQAQGQALVAAQARERDLRFECRLNGCVVRKAKHGRTARAWDLRLILARLAARRRDWPQAERWYAKLLLDNAEQPRIFVQYGHALKEQGAFDLAACAYARALPLPGADVDLVGHLAFVLRASGRQAEAEAVERDVDASEIDMTVAVPRSSRGASKRAPPLNSLGRLAAIRAAKAGDWTLAAHRYKALVRAAPHHAPFWVQYGHALKEAGSRRDAFYAYRTAVRLDPHRADAHLQLGHALKLLRLDEDAKRAYGRAFLLAPADQNARRELEMSGMTGADLVRLVLEAGARPERRRGGLGTSLLDLALAKLSAKRKDWAAAARRYQRRVKQRPEDWRSWVQLGHALKEQGGLAEAEGAYLQALTLQPKKAEVHLQLGHALKLAGRLEEAAEAYRRAHGLDPDLKEALRDFEAAKEEVSRIAEAVLLSSTGGQQSTARVDSDDAVLRQRLGLTRRQERLWRDLNAAVKAKTDA